MSLMELKYEMERELKAARTITNAGGDLSPADEQKAAEHLESYKRLKRDYDRAEKTETVKANLAAIGLDLGLGDVDPDAAKNIVVERAGASAGYKQAAAAQWALQAAERMQRTVEAVGGVKSIAGTMTPVPDIITGPVNLPEERHTILNLIPTKDAGGESIAGPGGNVFGYAVQTTRTNNANAVLQAGLKPESVYQWQSKVDRFRKIAHRSEPQPDEILEDFPTLLSFLTEEMGRGVLDELESQILNGTGTIAATPDGTPTVAEEQLPGILLTSGIQSQAWDTDLLTTLSAAYDKLVLANEEPNAWILHPLDYRRLKNMRESGTTGPLMFKSGRSSIEQILGEIPVVTTALIAQGTGLIGDFRKTQLVIRKGVEITSSNGDSTLFDYNLTRYIAEMRAGLAVLRPNAFVKVDLTAE